MQRIVQRDQRTHAVTPHEERRARVLTTHQLHDVVYIAAIVGDTRDMSSLAARSAVPSEIQRKHRNSGGRHRRGNLRVASAVFAESMHYDQRCPLLTVG